MHPALSAFGRSVAARATEARTSTAPGRLGSRAGRTLTSARSCPTPAHVLARRRFRAPYSASRVEVARVSRVQGFKALKKGGKK